MKKFRHFLVISLRHLFFHASWLSLLFLLANWHLQFLFPLYKQVETNPYRYLIFSIIWFTFAWIITFFCNLLWPVLLLTFYKTQRIRNPKTIIQVGDRFRKMGLSSPQIYVTDQPSSFWLNKVVGFFALPSPFGSLLLVPQKIADLNFEEFDIWICKNVIESKFYKYSRMSFQYFLFLPISAMVGLLCAEHFFQGNQSALLALLTTSVLTNLIILIYLYRQNLMAIDFRTIRSFHLNSEDYFRVLLKSNEDLRRLFSNEKRRQIYSEKDSKFSSDIYIPSAKPKLAGLSALLASYIAIFTLVLSSTTLDINITQLTQQTSLPDTSYRLPTSDNNLTETTHIAASTITDSFFIKGNIDEATTAALAPITKAVISGDIRKVIRTLNTGIKLDFQDPSIEGATPLLISIRKADLEMTYILLALGARFTDIDSLGRNAYFYAIESVQPELVVRYVMHSKVDPYSKDNQGQSAVDYAKSKNLIEIVRLLESNK